MLKTQRKGEHFEACTHNRKAVGVVLFHNRIPVARCTAFYTGLLGLFVDVKSVHYPKFTPVEVEVCAQTRQGSKRCRLPAVVTHSSSDGIGLTFNAPKSKEYSAYREIVAHMLTSP